MDPITATLLIIGIVGTLAGTTMSYQAKKAAGQQAQYNADHAAKVEEMQAEEEKLRRSAQERQERKQARMRRASIEADFAKSGLLMTGTPVYLLEEQAKADEMNILEGNRISSVGFMRSMERARLIRQQGKFDKSAADYGATTTLISGAGSLALTGASFSAAGGFGPKTPPPPGAGGTMVSGGGQGAGYNNGMNGRVTPGSNNLFNA
jgi:hypothetical protein